MDSRSQLMLHLLANKFHPRARENLESFLPEEERGVLTHAITGAADVFPLLHHAKDLLQTTHYSWLEPLVVKFPSSLQKTAKTSFSSTAAQKWSPVQSFFANQFYLFLEADQHLPTAYLPSHELSPLLSWTKEGLVTLIQGLGMYDLREEMREIVDKVLLQRIQEALSLEQKRYLRVCPPQKERLHISKLGVHWPDMTKYQLQRALQKRGLARLAGACGDLHPDFVWALAHLLDRGRGQILLKFFSKPSIPKVVFVLKPQVLHLMDFLSKPGPIPNRRTK